MCVEHKSMKSFVEMNKTGNHLSQISQSLKEKHQARAQRSGTSG